MGKENNTIAKKLEDVRVNNRFSQEFMGELLGVSQQVYSNIEKGKNQKYDPDFLLKMNNLLSGNIDAAQKEAIKTAKGDDFTIKIVIEPVNPEEGIKLSTPKEIIPVGKHTSTSRLKPADYEKAYGDWPGVPMYNAPVTASFVQTYRDESIYQPAYYLHDPRFKDCKFGAIITGDSMHSEIRHGDHVLCQEITDWSFVVFGDIYYIVSKNGLETCKYLNADPNDKNNFLLVPRNELISPSPINKKMIDKMYKVRGVVRGY